MNVSWSKSTSKSTSTSTRVMNVSWSKSLLLMGILVTATCYCLSPPDERHNELGVMGGAPILAFMTQRLVDWILYNLPMNG